MSTVIIEGARTPLGKLLGSLAPLSATDLGSHAIDGALTRSGIAAADIEAVYFGNVVQAGVGPNAARLSAVGAAVPLSASATTINKLCLSGLTAIAHADMAIRDGVAGIAIAGGTESMSNAPHLTYVRHGLKYGAGSLADALDKDALICGLEGEAMGAATERHQKTLAITRQEQDEFAALSHERAAAAIEARYFEGEIVPIAVPGRKETTVVSHDEGVRPQTTEDSLAELPPAFAHDGTITAGSASQLSDGAAALVIMDKAEAEKRGLTWLAEIVSYGAVAGPDASLLHQPANAIQKAAARAEIAIDDLDLVEINEAFASVVIASMRELSITAERVNINGGAISLGHPVGMSGTRLVLTLAHALRRRGGGVAAAALCGGGGQGDALIIKV